MGCASARAAGERASEHKHRVGKRKTKYRTTTTTTATTKWGLSQNTHPVLNAIETVWHYMPRCSFFFLLFFFVVFSPSTLCLSVCFKATFRSQTRVLWMYFMHTTHKRWTPLGTTVSLYFICFTGRWEGGRGVGGGRTEPWMRIKLKKMRWGRP